jgi:hypothetical protein
VELSSCIGEVSSRKDYKISVVLVLQAFYMRPRSMI